MKARFLMAGLFATCIPVMASNVPTQPSVVTVSGHQLIVQKRLPDGTLDQPRPYVIHGVDWSPATRAPDNGPNPLNPSASVPYGFFFDWAGRYPEGHDVMNYWLKTQTLANFQTDIQLLQKMNVNTVRVYTDFGTTQSDYNTILDGFYNAGIMVIMTVVGSTQDVTSGQYLTAVNLAKNHPAILMWAIGNEWNLNSYYGSYQDLTTLAGAITMTQQAAGQIKAIDSNHPITSVLGDRFSVTTSANVCLNQLLESDVPTIVQRVTNVDLWGLNIYRGTTFTNLFQEWANTTSKPFYLSEFGTDSYATTSFTTPYTNPTNGCPSAEALVSAGNENQSIQSNFDVGLWQQISPQLSVFYPQNQVVGGLVFEFNDEIWKVGNYNVGLGDVVDHTAKNYTVYDAHGFGVGGSAPDGVLNQEYFGLVNADRTPKTAFNNLETVYANLQSTPTVSITAPVNNSQLLAGTTLTLTVNAVQTGGTISQVSFYAGSTQLGIVTSAPYQWSWSESIPGTYQLRAVATNGAGLYSNSLPISVTVKNPAAAFIKVDSLTQGTWKGVYGSQGYAIAADTPSYPTYALATFSAPHPYTWSNPTTAVTALQVGSGTTRIASTWFSATTLSLDLNLTDGATHQVALYVEDWDYVYPRAETIEVHNALTGALLDSRPVTFYNSGQYLVWNLSGHVFFKVINGPVGSANALINGIFFDAAATPPVIPATSIAFISTDTVTQGQWEKAYGKDGYAINGDPLKYPTYVQIMMRNESLPVWTSTVTDIRALQQVNTSTDIVSGWYSATNWVLDMNLTDGNSHQVAFYLEDWKNSASSQTIEVRDLQGNLLDHRVVNHFNAGEYLVWTIKGHVVFNFGRAVVPGSSYALLSGMFFGGPPVFHASFIKVDSLTQGSWKGTYGSQGYAIAVDAPSYPAYAVPTFSGASLYTWSNPATALSALQTGSGTTRIASTWFNTTTFSLDLNLTDGATHQVALYVEDWDYVYPRAETIEVHNAITGALLDTRSVTFYNSGQYLIWNLSGHVIFKVINAPAGSANALLNGIFFDAAANPSALPTTSIAFISTDTVTQGQWEKAYGKDGYAINGDPLKYPTYAQITMVNEAKPVWTSTVTDIRAMQQVGISTDIVSGWYSATNWVLDMNLTDGNSHQVAFYLEDWKNTASSQTIEVRDLQGTLLDRRVINHFNAGEYLIWTIKGHVVFNFGRAIVPGSAYAVLSGQFFGGAYASASTALAAPLVQWPATLSNTTGEVQVSYPIGTTVVEYQWTLQPLQNSANDQASTALLNSTTIPQSPSVSGSKLSLETIKPPIGRYQISVMARTSVGQLSPPTQATVQLIPDASASTQETISDLNSVHVYPNPWRVPRDVGSRVTFTGMPLGSTVELFTVSAHFVKTLGAPSGTAYWDLTNDSGQNVASGIYLYLITDSRGNKTRGELGVIR